MLSGNACTLSEFGTRLSESSWIVFTSVLTHFCLRFDKGLGFSGFWPKIGVIAPSSKRQIIRVRRVNENFSFKREKARFIVRILEQALENAGVGCKLKVVG